MPLHLRSSLAAGLVVLVSLLSAASATADPSPDPIVLGANTAEITSNTGPALDSFDARAGAPAQIAMYYQDWNEGWSTALLNPHFTKPIAEHGAVPMITWEPLLDSGNEADQPDYAPARIAAGAFDPYIRRAAKEAAAYGQPFFIRLAHEMNGGWYEWSAINGNTPADYVAMWRHVVSIFREEGATNARWVWSPNVTSYKGASDFAPFYPGDEWVDYVALDGYNWGSLRPSGWLSFKKVFLPSYQALAKLSDKPMMIAETSSTETGGDKAAWIREMSKVLPEEMPRVRALVWFDREKETDWRVDSSPSVAAAFQEVAASPLFSGNVQSLLEPPPAPAQEEAPPVLRIGDSNAQVGQHAHPVWFTVKSSKAVKKAVVIHYQLKSSVPGVRRHRHSRVHIPAGHRTARIKVWVPGSHGRAQPKRTRRIWVRLSPVRGARLAKHLAKGTVHFRR